MPLLHKLAQTTVNVSFPDEVITAVSKYVGTRKKIEQTMKFQVLVAWCGIALSLSGL